MLLRRSAQMLTVVSVLAVSQLSTCSTFAQGRPPKARITTTMQVTNRDGGSLAGVGAGSEMAVGDSHTWAICAGADGEARAAGGVSLGCASEYWHKWTFHVTLVSTDTDAVTFDLDWERAETNEGSRRAVAGDHRRITLRQGERHVLDFVPSASAGSRVASMVIEVTAVPVEDPAIAEQRLAYDLWLVHETANGAKVTRRTTMTGRQGEKVPFALPSVSLPLDAGAPSEADSPLRMHVQGSVTGRAGSDGTTQVALEATVEHRSPVGRSSPPGGLETFTAKLGEAIAVELLTSGGQSAWRPQPGTAPAKPRPGVTVTADGLVRVDHKVFFAGTKTSIIVTVRKDD
jgi:hypothetical protein